MIRQGECSLFDHDNSCGAQTDQSIAEFYMDNIETAVQTEVNDAVGSGAVGN